MLAWLWSGMGGGFLLSALPEWRRFRKASDRTGWRRPAFRLATFRIAFVAVFCGAPVLVTAYLWRAVYAPLSAGGVVNPIPGGLYDILFWRILPGFAAACLLCVFLWSAFSPGFRRYRRFSRLGKREPLCAECGYRITGLASLRCPECGTPIPGALPETTGSRPEDETKR
jgi:hypothetical protein